MWLTRFHRPCFWNVRPMGIWAAIPAYFQSAQMNTQSTRRPVLLDTLRKGLFYDLSEEDVIRQVGETFRPELERLKNAYAIERGSSSPQLPVTSEEPTTSPSQVLFGQDYDEVNRTLTGVLALRWIYDGNYSRFVSAQSSRTRLHRQSFEWLRDFFLSNLKSPEDVFALILSMVVNDLGKDPNLEEDYHLHTKKLIKGQNHDTILLEAAKVGLVPCLKLLDERHHRDVMLGLELGSELNASQLAQAENVPINLEGLLDMRGNVEAFNLKFMEQILDVAGAAAHYNPRGAKNLIEPVFQAFKTVHEVSLNIIDGNCTLRQGYDTVLTKRGDMLSTQGFRRLSVSDKDERALLRLLTMGRTASFEQAELFSNSFEALDQEDRELLVQGLNIDGDVNEIAVLPYYMPAMLSEALENLKTLPNIDQERALTSLMRYLARVLRSTGVETISEIPAPWLEKWKEQNQIPGGGVPGIVIERNMIKARETISSDEFRRDPKILDELEIPQGQILQRRRTSHSL